jgi:hypothetical protein
MKMDEKYFTEKIFELDKILDEPMNLPMAQIRKFLKQIARDQREADIKKIILKIKPKPIPIDGMPSLAIDIGDWWNNKICREIIAALQKEDK